METACIKCNAVSMWPLHVDLHLLSGGGASHQRHWIAIGRKRSYHAKACGLKPRGTHRSFDLNLTAVLHRDRSLIGRSRPFIYLSFIGRRRRIMEELRDRGAIEPRSRRDRAAIMEHFGAESSSQD